ncbi:Spectrin beta chain non-erythrocytic 1 [Dissostichus eleginoides]|uniref:Spectrin beta chain non-erythrocytic 1 n=1 Tax=Dissostichus eleginoides TaxID=100907 RepID=A0AAD9B497_DISEL|nr:Spectrin beta chain non-erythrocytic 1 [Dissostichus eleginoides]
MMTAMELDHMDLQTSVLQTQFSSSNDTVNNRWDEEWDNENSSARLFERSRIKALAGERPTQSGMCRNNEWKPPTLMTSSPSCNVID